MRQLVPGVLLMLATTACLGGGGGRPQVSGSPPPPSPAESALIGQWELVAVEAQGAPRQASGHLSFDAFNNIAVHAELAPGELGTTPPRVVLLDFSAKAIVSPGELGYLGLERRAPAEQMIPMAAEPAAWRHYAVEGETLRLWQADASGRPIGTLVFRRRQ